MTAGSGAAGSRNPKVVLIVAMARNRVIGKDGALPWRLPEDLKRFRSLTMGHPIVMGRKTYDSIGKPLPGRTNIVMSRRAGGVPDGVVLVSSLEDAFKAAEATGADEACVTGGAEIYALALPYAHTLHYTCVHMDAEGDTLFPVFDQDEWTEVSSQRFEAGENDSAAFTILRFDRAGDPPRRY